MSCVGLRYVIESLRPSSSVFPFTSVLMYGRRLSSVVTVRDSVPVCSMMTLPLPPSETAEKPDTVLGSVMILPDPATESKTQAPDITLHEINSEARMLCIAPPVRSSGHYGGWTRQVPIE